MKYCKSCGKELNDHAKFCTGCGAKCKIDIEIDVNSPTENKSISNASPCLDTATKKKGRLMSKLIMLIILLTAGIVVGTAGILIFQPFSDNGNSVYYISTTHEFSEGLAWIATYTKTLTGSSGTQYACIDTDGNVQFMLEEGSSEPTPFANGVSCYTDASGIYTVINKNGNVVFSSADGLYDDVLISGEGYHAVYTYKENFQISGYEVNIINPNGKMIKLFSDLQSEIPELIYCGEGIFAYCTWRSAGGSNHYNFFNTSTQKWFEVREIAHNNSLSYIFVNGVALVERGSGRMLDKPILIFADGTVKELDITDYNYYKYGRIADGGFVFTSYYDDKVESVRFYNIETGKVTVLGNYGERVDLNRIESLHYDNGHLLLPLIGADGKKYYTILDKSGRSLFDPVPCESAYSINGDRIGVWYTSGTAILDGNGKVIVENVKGPTSLSYNDGWSVYDNSTNYIDTRGNLMFEDGNLVTN